MKTDDLRQVAWLANWGLRHLTGDQASDLFRLSFAEHEKANDLLETFERKVARDLFGDAEDKSDRFEASWNRATRLWDRQRAHGSGSPSEDPDPDDEPGIAR
jgi:hypothetical protein